MYCGGKQFAAQAGNSCLFVAAKSLPNSFCCFTIFPCVLAWPVLFRLYRTISCRQSKPVLTSCTSFISFTSLISLSSFISLFKCRARAKYRPAQSLFFQAFVRRAKHRTCLIAGICTPAVQLAIAIFATPRHRLAQHRAPLREVFSPTGNPAPRTSAQFPNCFSGVYTKRSERFFPGGRSRRLGDSHFIPLHSLQAAAPPARSRPPMSYPSRFK